MGVGLFATVEAGQLAQGRCVDVGHQRVEGHSDQLIGADRVPEPLVDRGPEKALKVLHARQDVTRLDGWTSSFRTIAPSYRPSRSAVDTGGPGLDDCGSREPSATWVRSPAQWGQPREWDSRPRLMSSLEGPPVDQELLDFAVDLACRAGCRPILRG
jgi:hypothetical protein